MLVGEHGLVNRVPIHRAELAVHDAFFEQFGKQQLLPAVIIGATGGDFALPIQSETQRFKLLFHIINVGIRPRGGGNVVVNRGVFGGHTKCVPAHRLQHVVALHFFETAAHIADGVVANVPHVQLAAGVGEHGEAVEFGFAGVFGYVKRALRCPFLLGGGLDERGLIVFLHGDFACVGCKK